MLHFFLCSDKINHFCNYQFQETFPLRFHQVHVVNVSKFLRMGYNMIKPFLNEEVKKSIIFHDNLSSLHTYVDKQILPEELGGRQGPFDDSAASAAVLNMSKYFESVQNYIKCNSCL